MWFSFVLVVAILSAGLAGGMAIQRRFSGWSPQYRLLAALLPVGLSFTGVSWISQILSAPDFKWNQARLAPLFSWWHGNPLYYPSGAGPVLDAIYGPVSYMAYFPTLVAQSPVPAVLIGSAMASLYVLAPVVWIFMSGDFRRGEGRAVGLFLLVLFGLWVIGAPALRYSAFSSHADAPALGFAAAACAMLIPANWSRRPMRPLVLTAVFAVLAMCSKQSLVFLVPTLVCFIWITDGRRLALQFAAGVTALSASVWGLFFTIFSPQALYFNLYQFPSRDSFGSGYFAVPREGSAYALGILLRVTQRLWDHSRWLILAVAVCCVVEFYVTRPRKIAAREWLRQNRWAVFHFVALGGFPLALYFGAKVGGDINSYSLHLYFNLIGFLIFLGHLVLKHETVSRPAAAMCVIVAATLLPTGITSFEIPKLVRNLQLNETAQVYRYARQHPGETYFAFFPLPVLMAEGGIYHFEFGVFHRKLGRAPVSPSQFAQYIPPHPKAVQMEDRVSPIHDYLPEYSCEIAHPPIATLHFYAVCSGANAAQ